MTEFNEHIEIFRETCCTRFEAWQVLIDPKEKLYPNLKIQFHRS
ncbi:MULTISPECIES: hypothetical protein [Sphingobacterium]|nr:MULTISPECIES: hypothetical protein [Sphingobacterium]